MSHKAGGLKQWISAAQPRKRQKQTVFPPLRPYPQLPWRNQSWGCRRCIRQQCERARGRRRRWRVVSPSPPLWGLWSASMSSSAAPAPKKNSNRLPEMKNKCKFWQTNACLHEPHYHVDANAGLKQSTLFSSPSTIRADGGWSAGSNTLCSCTCLIVSSQCASSCEQWLFSVCVINCSAYRCENNSNINTYGSLKSNKNRKKTQH